MFFAFDFPDLRSGVHVATYSGTARVELLDGNLRITLIRLDGMRKGSAELRRDSKPLRDAWLFSDIALWLHRNHYADIKAEWDEHCARQAPKEVAA